MNSCDADLRSAQRGCGPIGGLSLAFEKCGVERSAPCFRGNAVPPAGRRCRPAIGGHARPRRWRISGLPPRRPPAPLSSSSRGHPPRCRSRACSCPRAVACDRTVDGARVTASDPTGVVRRQARRCRFPLRCVQRGQSWLASFPTSSGAGIRSATIRTFRPRDTQPPLGTLRPGGGRRAVHSRASIAAASRSRSTYGSPLTSTATRLMVPPVNSCGWGPG
jgi:hypothetical protein